ncbi:hypothetical protein E1176_08380, partial [Fulvivirga sp. RKSG066]|uniref:hypothetical protein n=1 Tax=Fulvivirga aurantia TaxID=2529383 RepID=UPI0012BB71DF
MRYLIMTFFTIAVSIQTYSQEREISLESSAIFIRNTLRIFTSPTLSIQSEKHAWSLGPTIAIASGLTTSDEKYPKLGGLQVSYRYYPLNKNSR